MHDPLAPLLADGVIDAVLSRLKSGKEAELWLVQHRDEVLAAKVYKARQARSFKNNAAYTEGRQVRNSRTQRAMDRGTRFGRAAAEEAWKAREADALHALHAAGVRVPRPVIFYEGVLVMELVVDAVGHPAPRLVDATFPPGQAAALYADLRSQAVRMLACDLVHGDLSPFNVLLAWNGPTVIDFPQAVGAAHNRQAERFFERDLESLRRFFQAHDPSLQAAAGDAREIWRAYERRELTADFVPSGRPPPPRPAAPPARSAGHGEPRSAGHGEPRSAGHGEPRTAGHGESRGDRRGRAGHEPRRDPQPHQGQRGPPAHAASRAPSPHPRAERPPAVSHGPGQGSRHGQPHGHAAPQPSHGQRREPDRGAQAPVARGDRPPPRDRARPGGPRTVVVERLGPRAPSAPGRSGPGHPPGGAPAGPVAHASHGKAGDQGGETSRGPAEGRRRRRRRRSR